MGEFREEGYLPEAMINYLSLLGWNDGTEQEVYTVRDLLHVVHPTGVLPECYFWRSNVDKHY